MVGSATYTDEEILWILDQVLAKAKPADIQSGFSHLFGRDIGPSQIRYVKNKYGKDPRFNSPLINRRTAASSPYVTTTPRVAAGGVSYYQVPPQSHGHAHPPPRQYPRPGLPQAQGAYYLPRAGVRRPRDDDDDQPGGRPHDAERATKRRREHPPQQPRLMLPTPLRPSEKDEEEQAEEEDQDESHGTSQAPAPAAQEHPSQRARRAHRTPSAAPSSFSTASAVAAAAPPPPTMSLASQSNLSRGNPTPQYYAARAQRAATGERPQPRVPEIQDSTPFSRGPPRATHFEASSSRNVADTGHGRDRAADDEAAPDNGGSQFTSDSSQSIDSTDEEVDSPYQYLPLINLGRQTVAAPSSLGNLAFAYQQPANMGSNAGYTAHNMPYYHQGGLPVSAPNANRFYDLTDVRPTRRVGSSRPHASSSEGAAAYTDAALVGNTRLRSRNLADTGSRAYGNFHAQSGIQNVESSANAGEELVSQGLGGGQDVTNLPNLNRPPGPGFAVRYYNQPSRQQASREPREGRRRARRAGPGSSARAMPPPPLPRSVAQSSQQAAAPSRDREEAQHNVFLPEIWSQEWLEQRYSAAESQGLLDQYLNDPEFGAFPFDHPSPEPAPAQPFQPEPEPYPGGHGQASAVRDNPPVQAAAAPVQRPQEADPPRPLVDAVPTPSVVGRDHDRANDGPGWDIVDAQLPNPVDGENPFAPQDFDFDWATVSPNDLLLQHPDQGQPQPEQILQEAGGEEAALAALLSYDADEAFRQAVYLNEQTPVPFVLTGPFIGGDVSLQAQGAGNAAAAPLALPADAPLFFDPAGPGDVEHLYKPSPSPPKPEAGEGQASGRPSPATGFDGPAAS